MIPQCFYSTLSIATSYGCWLNANATVYRILTGYPFNPYNVLLSIPSDSHSSSPTSIDVTVMPRQSSVIPWCNIFIIVQWMILMMLMPRIWMDGGWMEAGWMMMCWVNGNTCNLIHSFFLYSFFCSSSISSRLIQFKCSLYVCVIFPRFHSFFCNIFPFAVSAVPNEWKCKDFFFSFQFFYSHSYCAHMRHEYKRITYKPS